MWARIQSLGTRTPVGCKHCGQESRLISQSLGLCSNCVRRNFDEVLPIIKEAHSKAREPFALPPSPPTAEAGVTCRICINKCSIPEDGVSYCELRTSTGGRLRGATTDRAKVSWYYDPLPNALLAFHPDFAMSDLPPTSRHQAMDCLEAAKAAGLNRVRLGNIHLLGAGNNLEWVR